MANELNIGDEEIKNPVATAELSVSEQLHDNFMKDVFAGKSCSDSGTGSIKPEKHGTSSESGKNPQDLGIGNLSIVGAETLSPSTALSSPRSGDVQGLNQKSERLTPGTIPGEQAEMFFCSTPVKDSYEQRMDQKIKDTFGADVFDHLKDWDWLIANRKKLEDGFKNANDQDKWDMARRMRELSMVDGKPLIYLTKQDGPTHGNLIPKRYDIYLRRGSFCPTDDYLSHVYH